MAKKDEAKVTIDDILADAGINVVKAKASLAKMKAAFGVTGIPDAALRRWVDDEFHGAGPEIGMAIGKLWAKED